MTTMEFRDGSNVTIRSTDSESLVAVATRIKDLRDRANASSRGHSRAVDNINNDESLSDQGKKELIDNLNNKRSDQRKAWIADEKEIITNKITELERRLDGHIGFSSESIMAFRDAQDRAESIDDADKAATVMARAIRTNDRTLAHALYRRAVEQRWDEARQAFANHDPAIAQLAHDVQKLHELLDANFNRTVAYW